MIEMDGTLLLLQVHSGRWLVGTQLQDGRPLSLSLETIDDVSSHLSSSQQTDIT